MKHSLSYTCGFIWGLLSFLLSSCEDVQDGRGAGEDDRVSEVRFELKDIGGCSKSILPTDDRRLDELSIFAYADGYLEASGHFKTFSDMSLELSPDKVYDFYAVANMGEAEPPVSEDGMADFRYVLQSVGDMSEVFPMCWSVEGLVPSDGSPVSISLSRLVAKVRLNVSCEVEGLSVASARLMQSPMSVCPFAEGGSRAVAGMTMDGDKASDADVIMLNSGKGITLYVLENMQGTLLPGNDDPMLKVPDNLDERSGLCTYLEVSCVFEDGHDKEGTVVYRMYLGEDNVSNFDVERNRVLNVSLSLTSDGLAIKDSWKIVPDYIQHVTFIELAEEEITMRIGREQLLHAYVYPADASDDAVIWESDDESVAAVGEDGKVRGVGEGSCVVRARSADRPEISGECLIHVENRVEELWFLSEEVSVVLGSDGAPKHSPFNVEARYSDGTVRDVTNICGYSSDSVSAYVETPGVVVHASGGTAVISAECDGVNASMTAVTEEFAVAGLELNVPHLTLPLGDTFILKFRMQYNDGTVSSWIPYGFAGVGNASAEGWTSDDYGIADISTYGVVRPVSVGSADISIRVTDTRTSRSFMKSLTVRVTEAYVVGVYVDASPMFCAENYSLGLVGVFSDGSESNLKADSWTVSSPYVTFTDGSAGLRITDESMLQEGKSYDFTAVYGNWTSTASVKYGKWVLEAGIGKDMTDSGGAYEYRMTLVMCDHSRKYVPFTYRYSLNKVDWLHVQQVTDVATLQYHYPYIEATSASSYYDWEGNLRQWTVRNY